jgi:hypothetical protein
MELPVIDFYGFVGIVIPGTLLLVAVEYLFGLKGLNSLLIPDNFGSLGIHLLMAYFVGHLLQGVGNLLEFIYWKLWKGMPTDWPITHQTKNVFQKQFPRFASLLNNRNPKVIPRKR